MVIADQFQVGMVAGCLGWVRFDNRGCSWEGDEGIQTRKNDGGARGTNVQAVTKKIIQKKRIWRETGQAPLCLSAEVVL